MLERKNFFDFNSYCEYLKSFNMKDSMKPKSTYK